MSYFKNEYANISELRTDYYKLAKEHHPDMGGSLEEMKAVNNAYDKIYKQVIAGGYKDFSKWSEDFKEKFYTNDAELRSVIDSIVHFPDLDIEVCGVWLWVGGDTKKYKTELKGQSMRFSGKKMKWYWHPKGYRKFTKGEWSFEKIKSTFGSTKIESEELKTVE